MAGGRLQADPLFQGLTRPAMLLGVSYLYFVMNFMICVMLFINVPSVKIFVVALIVHGIGYMICLREPRAVELAMVKFAKTMSCRNRVFHGFTNSYDPY